MDESRYGNFCESNIPIEETTTVSFDDEEEEEGLGGGDIAGIVIGTLLGLCCCCLLCLFAWRRYKRRYRDEYAVYQPNDKID